MTKLSAEADIEPPQGDRLPQAVDPQAFRDAMARVASPVHVVTTAGPAGRGGFTATAVASVSDSPPTVLICLNRKSRQNSLFQANGVFCINVASGAQRAVAETFSGLTGIEGEARFDVGSWSSLSSGAPALDEARAVLDCRIVEVKPVGSHNIYFGLVLAVRTGASPARLLYHDRSYHEI